MSERNGDRARYQRFRKAGLRRRERARAVHAELKRRSAARRLSGDNQAGDAPERVQALQPETRVTAGD